MLKTSSKSPDINFHISGIILAAGKGARFDPTGQRYKLAQMLPNKQSVITSACLPLIQHTDSLIIVHGERGDELNNALVNLPAHIRRVRCIHSARGMGASLKCGILASRQAQAWLIGLADMPYLQEDTVNRVTSALRTHACLVRPFYKNRPGHPVGIAAPYLSELLSLPDEAGAAMLLRRHQQNLTRIDVEDAGCVMDVDYPEDLLIEQQYP